MLSGILIATSYRRWFPLPEQATNERDAAIGVHHEAVAVALVPVTLASAN